MLFETEALVALLAASKGGLTETELGLLELLVTTVVWLPALDVGSASTAVMLPWVGGTPAEASMKETPG